MAPRIVAQIDRRVSEIACQRRAVIVFLSSPVAVAQAQAVNENDDAAARPRQSRRKRFPGEMKLLSIGPEAHRNCERIAGRDQVIAHPPPFRTASASSICGDRSAAPRNGSSAASAASIATPVSLNAPLTPR